MTKSVFFLAEGGLSPWNWAFVLGFFVGNAISVVNPFCVGAMSVCNDVMAGISDVLFAWEVSLENVIPTKTSEEVVTKARKEQDLLDRVLHQGLDIRSLSQRADSACAPLVLAVYSYLLAGGIAYLYGACGFLMVRARQDA